MSDNSDSKYGKSWDDAIATNCTNQCMTDMARGASLREKEQPRLPQSAENDACTCDFDNPPGPRVTNLTCPDLDSQQSSTVCTSYTAQ